jgi:hypothetical protein
MTPKEIWLRALEEPIGIAISECSASFEQEIIDFRKGNAELFGFYVVRKGTEVWIIRARNLSTVRTDGEYAPVED